MQCLLCSNVTILKLQSYKYHTGWAQCPSTYQYAVKKSIRLGWQCSRLGSWPPKLLRLQRSPWRSARRWRKERGLDRQIQSCRGFEDIWKTHHFPCSFKDILVSFWTGDGEQSKVAIRQLSTVFASSQLAYRWRQTNTEATESARRGNSFKDTSATLLVQNSPTFSTNIFRRLRGGRLNDSRLSWVLRSWWGALRKIRM